MGINIVMYDVRIGWDEDQQKGIKPPPQQVILKNHGPNFYPVHPGDSTLSQFRMVAEENYKHIDRFSLYAHGYAMEDSKRIAHGGYGLQLGKDDLTVENAEAVFSLLNGKFDPENGLIELVGCAIAVSSRVGTIIGDGINLCEIISKAAGGIYVRASSDKQNFGTTPFTEKTVSSSTAPSGVESDPGSWEGNVWNIRVKKGKTSITAFKQNIPPSRR
jgi:hypothetical protein